MNARGGAGLSFRGMTHLGMHRGHDLAYSVVDKSCKVFLCVGRSDNRVPISGTTPLTRQPAVLKAIDNLAQWGDPISVWLEAERDGALVQKSPARAFQSHVKPYEGVLTLSGFEADKPRLTYPGNGHGRRLSVRINGKYYFVHGRQLVTEQAMRGFDCTTFPMALLEIRELPKPGYGKQLCEAAKAVKCELEQLSSADLRQRFVDDSIPPGKYILFSEGHVLLYDSDVNMLHEFTYGGYKATPAPERELQAKNDLWWMRKLGVEYYGAFM